jgi:hypothetical protein
LSEVRKKRKMWRIDVPDREKIAIGVDLRIRGGVRGNSMHKKIGDHGNDELLFSIDTHLAQSTDFSELWC